MREAARAYLDAGLCVLPARLAEKRPAVGSWKQYQKRLPTPAEVDAWFANGPDALCVLTGAVSGHLEMLDFDRRGELFDRWGEVVEAEAPGLIGRLAIERTQRDGRHAAYRYQEPVCGSMKLAHRPGPDGRPETLIETRGEGGLFLCAPSPGYELLQGDLASLPILTAAERDVLLSAAWALNEALPAPEPIPAGCSNLARPGDDFAARGDVRAVLARHGWALVKAGENEYWRRPGKTAGWSATLKDGVFYVFSSNAAPFEPRKAYAPFAVYAHLEHAGDFAAAARALRAEGYGEDEPAGDVDISGILAASSPAPVAPSRRGPEDPGRLPVELLRIPGFISEVVDHCLATAPYPNQAMAFGAAITLQAFLAGRRVRDPGDNRTNLYLLGLAHSGAGKNYPREVNTSIVHRIGLASGLGQRFASGEGIEDALFLTPNMLFQTDEIDGILQSINGARDARHESILNTLLTMFSSANSVFPMRRKARTKSSEPPGVIDQPCLTIFGTAIPNHYYAALSERMLTNGFFARIIVLEAGERPAGQEPGLRDLPQRLVDTAQWWADFQPGERVGNLYDVHPVPRVVEQTDAARQLLIEMREQAEVEYAKAEAANDPVGTTVWARVSEQVRKLALIYAVSEDHQAPEIGSAAVKWATAFVLHQTRRMLFMADSHVAVNPFHAECLKLLRKLKDAGGRMDHSSLLQRMHMKATDFRELIQTLVQQGDVEVITTPRSGTAKVEYQAL